MVKYDDQGYGLLNHAGDFHEYKQNLDKSYLHTHYGEPTHYPCKAISKFWDNPNGRYTYYHRFVYQQEVICNHCKELSLIWPEQAKS